MKKISTVIILLLMSSTITAQIGINATGANPDPSAGLDVSFTDKGLLMPRLTTVQRDAIQNPAVGLMIFNLDSDCIEVYFGVGQWKFVQCGCSTEPSAPSGIIGSIDVCLNQMGVNYSVPSQNGVSSYTWSSSEPNDIINGQGTNSIQIDFVGGGIRTLSVVANNSCGVSDTTILTVDSNNPNSVFTPLIGTFNQGVNFVAQTYLGATYSWTFDQGTPATSTIENPSVMWANTGVYAVSLTITDSIGCSSTTSDSIVISTCPPLGNNTDVFNYTAGVQTWVVPGCVTTIQVDAYGAQGGSGSGSAGGLGGRVRATLSVTPGETLTIYVGGQPNPSASAGYNGGGLGLGTAGGGGGGTDIRRNGNTFADRILVAGGGGGGGQGNGGAGGGLIGGQGSTNGAGVWAKGGTQSSGGAGGMYNNGGCSPGANYAPSGTFGTGGNGLSNSSCCCYGAGGGGGWYGGGGMQINGAGGGSSYVIPSGSSNIVHNQGVQTGNGQLTILW